MADKKPTELNEQQERFCREFILDLSATKAAVRAGYKEHSATQGASRLMTNELVMARIQTLMNERAKRSEITADTILHELLRLARVDIGDVYDENGYLLNVKDIPEDARRAIAGIDVFVERDHDGVPIGETKKIRFYDKTKALELIGKHLKLFTDRIEVSGSIGLAERLAKARKRSE